MIKPRIDLGGQLPLRGLVSQEVTTHALALPKRKRTHAACALSCRDTHRARRERTR